MLANRKLVPIGILFVPPRAYKFGTNARKPVNDRKPGAWEGKRIMKIGELDKTNHACGGNKSSLLVYEVYA
jgi:hypothetical protein